MPTSALGNSWEMTPQGCQPPRQRGFTLIELMVVVSLIAILAAVTTMSMRDPAATQLEREAARLTALLESARAHSRVMGIAVTWEPMNDRRFTLDETALTPNFAFTGLPPALDFPSRWLGEGVHAEVVGARKAVLGPEPMIGPQRILLRLDNQRLALATDGLGPFEVEPADDGP